jgi:hypothetical protein
MYKYVSVVALKNELRNSSRIPVRELDLKVIVSCS